jgi:hypothetical protein
LAVLLAVIGFSSVGVRVRLFAGPVSRLAN